MANSFNLGVDDNDIKELLEVVPEEMTNELLKLEQEYIAEGKRKGTCSRRQRRTPKKIPSKEFSRRFCGPP